MDAAILKDGYVRICQYLKVFMTGGNCQNFASQKNENRERRTDRYGMMPGAGRRKNYG